jgi:hypothetical protein
VLARLCDYEPAVGKLPVGCNFLSEEVQVTKAQAGYVITVITKAQAGCVITVINVITVILITKAEANFVRTSGV